MGVYKIEPEILFEYYLTIRDKNVRISRELHNKFNVYNHLHSYYHAILNHIKKNNLDMVYDPKRIKSDLCYRCKNEKKVYGSYCRKCAKWYRDEFIKNKPENYKKSMKKYRDKVKKTKYELNLDKKSKFMIIQSSINNNKYVAKIKQNVNDIIIKEVESVEQALKEI